MPGAGDVIKSIGKAIIKGADDITIVLLKKLDAEDTYRAFVKFRQTLQASTEEAVATINVWLKKAENRYKETELAELLSTTNERMNKAVEFVQAKVDEFGWKVFGREDIFEETARIKINKVVEVKFNIKNFEDNPVDKAEYIRQLKNQEEALNNLTIQEYLDNIENYKINGRGSESAKVQKKIREKVFELTDEEVPHSITSIIDSIEVGKDSYTINASIIVDRDSLKKIIIGKGGQKIKEVGIRARKEIEEYLGKKVYLDLFVKTIKKWRDKDKYLTEFGYNEFE